MLITPLDTFLNNIIDLQSVPIASAVRNIHRLFAANNYRGTRSYLQLLCLPLRNRCTVSCVYSST